jgi:hypothetical protein
MSIDKNERLVIRAKKGRGHAELRPIQGESVIDLYINCVPIHTTQLQLLPFCNVVDEKRIIFPVVEG